MESREACSTDDGSNAQGAEVKDIEYEPEYFELYPNPAWNEVEIRFVAERQEQIEIQLFNANGELVETYYHQALPGLNRKKIETYFISPGMYWINIPLDKRTLNGRFVKIRE